MTSFVADTNVWLRYVDPGSAHHVSAARALEAITAKGKLILVPQTLTEFWVVATRPLGVNGLGWTPEKTANLLRELLQWCDFRPDSEDITAHWLGIVEKFKVQGKRAHDAKLAAAVLAHKVDYLLTFNVEDFRPWPVQIAHPEALPAGL